MEKRPDNYRRPPFDERRYNNERPAADERSVRDERPSLDPGIFREGGNERDFRDERSARSSRDERDFRDERSGRDFRDERDPRDERSARSSRDERDFRDERSSRNSRDYRDSRDYRERRGGGFSGGSLDNSSLIKILAAVAGVLAVVLVIMLISKARLVGELKDEKAELTEQIEALQQDYEGLSSDYESINSQLDSSREEVNQLVERIKKTEATNRAQIRKYQKELGTLRTIMRNYIGQIDSLNQLNHKLTADAAAARRETAKVKKQNTQLQKTVDDLADKVETGSVIRGRNIKCEAYNSAGKVVDKASAAVRILTTLSLMENNLAEKGPVRVYIVISDPDGNLITNGESRSCNYGGGTIQTSASRQIDYQGSEVELSIYMNDVPSFTKGIYTVQVLTERSLLGTAQFMLR